MSSILTLALHHHHHFHLALTVQIRLTVVPLQHSWTAEPQVLVICCIKWSKKPSNPSLYLSVCLSVYLPIWSIMILYLVFWEPSEPSPESQRICSLDSACMPPEMKVFCPFTTSASCDQWHVAMTNLWTGVRVCTRFCCMTHQSAKSLLEAEERILHWEKARSCFSEWPDQL